MTNELKPGLLPIALRAYAVPAVPQSGGRHGDGRSAASHAGGLLRSALAFDTETTTDPALRLSFGSYRYFRLGDNGRTRCVEEGLFHADDLGGWYPDGLAALQAYATGHAAEVEGDVDRELRLYSRREFVRRVFLPATYQARALVIAFNMPFDLAHIAVDARPARGRFTGGFSLVLDEYEARDGERKGNTYKPRIALRNLDSKREFVEFRNPWRPGREEEAARRPRRFAGHFLDLRTLDFALSNEAHSLEHACELWQIQHPKRKAEQHGVITPDYIDYNRADVRATAELAWALLEEFNRHVS